MQEAAIQPFDKLSDIYLREPYSGISILRARRVLSILESANFRPRRILDLGCGCGVGTRELISNDVVVVGVDVSQSSLKRARIAAINKSNPLFALGDMRSLGFPNESFDLVVSLFDSLNYVLVEDLNLVISESFRVLKKGGIIALNFLTHTSFNDSDINPDSIYTAADFYYLSKVIRHVADDVHLELTAFIKDGESTLYRMLKENHVLHLFEREEVVKLLQNYGFKIIGSFDGEENRLPSDDSWHVILVAKKQ